MKNGNNNPLNSPTQGPINSDAKNPWPCAYTYQKYKAHTCPIMMYNIAKLYNNIQCLSSIKFKLVLSQLL